MGSGNLNLNLFDALDLLDESDVHNTADKKDIVEGLAAELT